MHRATHLSASQVDTFRQCSLKWHYRYREKAPDECVSGALVIGSVVDTAVKAGLHAVKEGSVRLEELNPDMLFEEAWSAELERRGSLPIQWSLKAGKQGSKEQAAELTRSLLSREDLIDYATRLELDLRFDLPLVDEELGVHLPEVTLVGILDAVETLSGGRVRPLDWKTAASRAAYTSGLEHHLQGSLYSWALRQIHGDAASDAMRFDVGLKLKEPIWETYEVNLGEVAQKRALLTVARVYEAMQAGHVFPEPSFLCGGCPYRRRCSTWQQNQVVVPVLDPFAVEIRTPVRAQTALPD